MTQDDSAARRAATLAAQVTQQIDQAIARDPAFRVLAVDGLAWICPYTGTAVAAPFGWEDPAKQWLREHQPWKQRPVMPLAQVMRQRWRLWLRANLESEGRLRLFGADGRWLNPFTGQWVRMGWKPGDQPAGFVEEAAGVLAGCPQAQAGKLIERIKLDALMNERIHRAPVEAAVQAPARSTGRVSGGDEGLALRGDDRAAMIRALERMLPDLPSVPGFAFAAHHEPAIDGGNDFHVGGRMADGRLFLAIGSILGAGTPYALAMPVAMKTAMGAIAKAREPLDVLRAVGSTMRAMLGQDQSVGMNVLVIDAAGRSCQAICAGLRPAIRLNLGRREVLVRVDEPGPALVQVAESELASELHGTSFSFVPGDTVVMWSDGLPRAADPKRVPFGDHRAMSALIAHQQLSLDDLLARLAAEARAWASDSFRGDVSILGLRATG